MLTSHSMKYFTYILFGMTALTSLSSFTAEASSKCLDKAVVEDILTGITLQMSDAPGYTEQGMQPNVTTVGQIDLCDTKSHSYKVLAALSLARTIRFAPDALSAPLNQGILTGDFWSYLRIGTRMVRDSTEDFPTCRSGFTAFANPRAGDGVIHVCPIYYDQDLDISERLQVILHELRHFSGHQHVTCTQGLRKGIKGACDQKIIGKGSYAVSVEALSKMGLFATNLTTPGKALAKLAALVYVNEAFNTNVLPKGFTATYMSDKNNGYIYDGGPSLFEMSTLPKKGAVVSRVDDVIFYPSDRSNSSVLDMTTKTLEKAPAVGMALTYNETPLKDREEVTEIVYGKYAFCSLKANKLNCTLNTADDLNKESTTLNFKGVALFESQELGLTGKDFVYIKSDNNELYRAKIDVPGKSVIEKVENIAADFKSLIVFQGKTRLGLSNNGEVLQFKENIWSPVAELSDKRIETMSRDFYWTEYLLQ